MSDTATSNQPQPWRITKWWRRFCGWCKSLFSRSRTSSTSSDSSEASLRNPAAVSLDQASTNTQAATEHHESKVVDHETASKAKQPQVQSIDAENGGSSALEESQQVQELTKQIRQKDATINKVSADNLFLKTKMGDAEQCARGAKAHLMAAISSNEGTRNNQNQDISDALEDCIKDESVRGIVLGKIDHVLSKSSRANAAEIAKLKAAMACLDGISSPQSPHRPSQTNETQGALAKHSLFTAEPGPQTADPVSDSSDKDDDQTPLIAR
jgi:hypothetical protein